MFNPEETVSTWKVKVLKPNVNAISQKSGKSGNGKKQLEAPSAAHRVDVA